MADQTVHLWKCKNCDAIYLTASNQLPESQGEPESTCRNCGLVSTRFDYLGSTVLVLI